MELEKLHVNAKIKQVYVFQAFDQTSQTTKMNFEELLPYNKKFQKQQNLPSVHPFVLAVLLTQVVSIRI